MEQTERFLKLDEVISRCGLSKTSIYRRIREKRFPRNIHLGGRRVIWLESEIRQWQNAQIEQTTRD
ncbi:helix-turn-helix transcriptional regulator [Mannheimia pernigra]|uniref:helix-turn-helix transcriptional regulator n=1 Tax=Mannheimia pernigra TaxID=111844 RepID=UPI00159F54D0|nr:AlpA family transcriptional regulator [Mannheimia pernigra]QLB43575.1 AlpA family transcriptional regulator [Mannheimia pernigra]